MSSAAHKTAKDAVVRKNLLRVMPWGDLPRPAPGAPGSRENPSESGILLVDKPAGVTSHDVVGAVRRLAGTRKVGHAGTLDPMATGLLTIGVGAATKLLTYMSGHDKTYLATIRFGASTTTEDAHGELIKDSIGLRPDFSLSQLDEAIAGLTGEIMQRPSSVSAIKVGGERAYDRVRRGESIELPERAVTIYSFVRTSNPRADYFYVMGRPVSPVIDVDIRVNCSAGTYIRALARDLGAALGMGAHLTMLRRVQVGALTIDQASSIVNLAGRVRAGQELPILPLVCAAESVLPASMRVSDEQAAALRHGQFIEGTERVKAWPVALIREEPSSTDEVGIVEKMSSLEKADSNEGLGTAEGLNAVEELSGKSSELVAIGKKRGKFIAPVVVFPK